MSRVGMRWASVGIVVATLGCSSSDKETVSDAGTGADADAGGTSVAAQHERLQRQLSASGTHACALRDAGLYCWGDNFFGQLGDESLKESAVAVEAVAAGSDIVQVVTNTGRTCVRRTSGEVACFGSNEWGQIGDGTRTNALRAVTVRGIDDAIDIAADVRATCVVRKKNGTVECWGESPESTPEAGSLVPMPIAGWSGIEEIRTGANSFFCARGRGGSVSCISFDGATGKWTQPQAMLGLSGARAIAVPSPQLVCAISRVGKIDCVSLVDGLMVQLPESEDSVGIDSLGTLAMVGVNAKGEWRLWNVPSFFWIAMGMQNVAGGQAYPLLSDVALTEVRVAGFQFCALRQDRSVACVDGGEVVTLESLDLAISTVIEGLPN